MEPALCITVLIPIVIDPLDTFLKAFGDIFSIKSETGNQLIKGSNLVNQEMLI